MPRLLPRLRVAPKQGRSLAVVRESLCKKYSASMIIFEQYAISTHRSAISPQHLTFFGGLSQTSSWDVTRTELNRE